MREHLGTILPALSHSLLEGTYQPGEIRRDWIPKVGGGERGLGIPNVIDRIVGQAVNQVLSPNYEPTFHGSSHGFRLRREPETGDIEVELSGGLAFFGIMTGETAKRTLHNLDAHIRRRLRALLLRQWKSKRSIVRRLIKLGIRRKTAWKTAYDGRRGT